MEYHAAIKKEWTAYACNNMEEPKIIMLRNDRIQKSSHCIIQFIENSRKYQLIYNDRKQIGGCLGVRNGTRQKAGLIRDTKFLNDGCAGAYMYRKLSNCTVYICIVHCMWNKAIKYIYIDIDKMKVKKIKKRLKRHVPKESWHTLNRIDLTAKKVLRYKESS